MRILLDFDGTIVDLWQRYYRVFCDINECQNVSLQNYIKIKRQFVRDENVAKELGIHLKENYFSDKRKLLEEPKYLNMDVPLITTNKLLEFVSNNPVNILTCRRNKHKLFLEMKRLGMGELIDRTIVLNPDDITKKEWIDYYCCCESVIVVGDGTADFETRKCRNVKVFMVNTGLMKIEELSDCGVEMIDSIEHFINNFDCVLKN